MKNNIVKRTIQDLDSNMSNFGFSQDEFVAAYGFSQNYGLDAMVASPNFSNPVKTAVVRATIDPTAFSTAPAYVDKNVIIENSVAVTRPTYATQYSGNPEIQKKTNGQSTFMVTIECNKTGTGGAETQYPIWLFGGDAFSNASTGYLAVQNSNQVTSLTTRNGKNVIKIAYGSGGNTTEYYISLGTSGEYPFILNSLTGNRKMTVNAIQMEISDTAEISQLTNEMKTFFLNEFGKADSNDLTTPTDLYQQQNNGIFIPHRFEISGRDGLQLSMNNSDGLITKMYFYAQTGYVKKA